MSSLFLSSADDSPLSHALNEPRAMQSCQYGSIPGTWVVSPPLINNLTYEWDVQLMAVSDSTDTHMLNYYLGTLSRRLGGNRSEAYRRVLEGARVQLHDRNPRVPILNHAVTNTGLTFYQMYMMGIDGRQSAEQLPPSRIGAARAQFDALFPGSTSKQEPDLIILHANHWTLKVRHETESGRTIDGHRGWINRMFVSQLNAAGRTWVALRLGMPLVDWEVMTRGLSPAQYLFDDVHPSDWFLFEAYNVFLNLLADYKQAQA